MTMKTLKYITQPTKVMRWTTALRPWIALLGVLSGAVGLYLGLFDSPPDYQQGETVRIMYVHVPASWWALGVYTLMAFTSVMAFTMKNPFMHYITKSLAPVGATFTLISLVTGAIWGKPTWGTWWVWDARLTSMLLLFFLYFGYLLLIGSHDNPEKGLKAGSVIAMVGWLNVPIIKWSVDWWYSLHQPASITIFAKPSIHSSMLWPLGLMALAFACYAFVVFQFRLSAEVQVLKQMRGDKGSTSLKDAA